MDDPRPDELLEYCGRLYWRHNAALAWSDGLADDTEAKTCSRSGSAAWKQAQSLRVHVADENAAAAFFRERARRRNPAVVASSSAWDLVEYDGDRAELDRRHGIPGLPHSLGWHSRRGPHVVYATPPGETPVKVQVDAAGVSVSSDGYLIAAPAWRREHGVVYALNGRRELATLPGGLRHVLLTLGAETWKQTRHAFERGRPVPEGHRDVAVFWAGVQLLRDGLAPAEVLERLLELNEMQCKPPLRARLVEKQFRGALKWTTAHPTETDRARAILEGRGPTVAPASVVGHAAAWEEPVPLRGHPPLPPFPLQALPAWLRRWCSGTAAEKAASVDLAAMVGLGVVSGAIARHVQVSPRPGWFEPTNGYFAAALEPGQRKTPVIKGALRPVRTIERKRMETWDVENQTIDIALAILLKRRSSFISEAADDDDLNPDVLVARQAEMMEGLGEVQSRPRPRLLTEDVTPEGLAQLLAEQGRIIAASDEGAAIFENFAGRYTRGSTAWDVFNKAHSGADLVVDRKSSLPVIVWDPALTLVLATQPDVLRSLWGKPDVKGRGVLARPLYSLPDPVYETGRTGAMEEQVLADFERRVRALFEDVPELALDEDGRPQPVTLRFNPDAETVFERYEYEIALERRELGAAADGDDDAAYLGWISKLAGQTARLAACLHAAAHWTDGVTISATIDSAAVSGAVDLARYFHAHAQVAFGLMGELPEQRRAQTILSWLSQRTQTELDVLTVRDVHRSRGKGTTAEQVRTALKLLEAHGYVRLERVSGRHGRPSERVLVNPVLIGKHPSVSPDKTDEKTGTSVGFVRQDGTAFEPEDAS